MLNSKGFKFSPANGASFLKGNSDGRPSLDFILRERSGEEEHWATSSERGKPVRNCVHSWSLRK